MCRNLDAVRDGQSYTFFPQPALGRLSHLISSIYLSYLILGCLSNLCDFRLFRLPPTVLHAPVRLPSAVTPASSACRLPYFPPASATDHRLRPPRLRPLPRLRTAAAIAAHRLPAPLAARAQPAFRAQGSSTEGGGANDARLHFYGRFSSMLQWE